MHAAIPWIATNKKRHWLSLFPGAQIFCEDMEDYELGEALRGDITDNPLDIYMRVSARVVHCWILAVRLPIA